MKAKNLVSMDTKKEAQIEIQAVAKIQYPIKSLITNANHSPPRFKAEISVGFWGN